MTSTPVFVDTSYLLALLNARDQYHHLALQLADQIDAPLLTTEAVLTELGNAFARTAWRKTAINAIRQLRQDAQVEILSVSPALFSQAFDLYASRTDKDWGLTDCISFAVMRERNISQALTADQHFEQAGFQALLREKRK
ncbi:MAG: PIN domain-containing protein [Anaerolineales bacterium]|nr:PIN domain-containing protein [Anaerolineales bacterium]MCX7756534.1 PIN domain-containing protein [Anaerolineales bacterium]MDW8279389.1 PIN domain-containing protein [Anaerolineales bacterium]